MKKISIIFILVAIFLPNITLAEFDQNHIISDSEAEDYNSLNSFQIQDFLEDNNSYLADFKYSGDNPSLEELVQDPEADYIRERGAATIIYNAAQESKINPKLLLTMLQKEQGLIEKTDPSERALNYAMGYYCYDGDYCNPKYKGFGKQVRATAQQFRWYMDHIASYDHQPGVRSCIDDPTPDIPCTAKGVEIQPENKITAAMYVYTPHLHGNKLFYTLWNKYGFGGDVPDNVISDGIFPDGALVKAHDSSAIYLISDGEKRAFASMTALVSRYDPKRVLSVDQNELDKYTDGDPINFANYSLLADSANNRYLIDGLTKRLISSDEVFRSLGFNPDEIETVSNTELDYFADGIDLTAASGSPIAALWQDSSIADLYLVKDNIKYIIIDSSIVAANYPDFKIKSVTTLTLNNLSNGGPVKLVDGALIKKETDPRVYVISDGVRRLITDEATFLGLGYTWTNIITVPNKVFNLHAQGPDLSL